MKKKLKHLRALLLGLLCMGGTAASAQEAPALTDLYTKREVMIPMRDGVRLYTAIYEPKNDDSPRPALMMRTPYSCEPYGTEEFDRYLSGYLRTFVDHHYILVFQDVRGRYHSEGDFVQVRPLNPLKRGAKDKKYIDEATDTYDTVEWLIHHTRSNQRVGTWGISYDGFYATMSASSGHPALRAVSPQAPVTDWFRGDDRHHNGAFTLLQTTNFLPALEGTHFGQGVMRQLVKNDVYTDFLRAGTFRDIDRLVGDTTETMWNCIRQHPDFDTFWQERDARRSCHDLKPAMLVVGGLYDSEDCYGAWGVYRAIKEQSPQTELYLTFGPWWHGAWTRRGYQAMGDVYFGESTSDYFMDEIHYPFFAYYLEGKGEKPRHAVNVFFSGANEWQHGQDWPLQTVEPTPYYIYEGGGLGLEAPTAADSHSEYVSDMTHPVPYTAEPTLRRTKEYMVDDQRFASARPDVLTFVTEPLADSLTLSGPIEVHLKVAIEGTDADFMVKVIDVFPEGFSYPQEVRKQMRRPYVMSGYELPVRGELFRGRYRTGFSTPSAFTPGELTDVDYTLYDVAHTFLPGHRLMVQVQSSWFPIIDRNPQRFVNTYECGVEDFLMKQKIQVFHQAGAASYLELPVVKRKK
jgi:putative CocE/NonD family hydrolase